MPMDETAHATFEAEIARFRELAAESGNRLLLGNGPPNPDDRLLELCADIAEQDKAVRAVFALPLDNSRAREFQAEWKRQTRRLATLLRAAAKLKARTAAGIYAKAVAVTVARTAAPVLCASLATDLIENPTLRAMLWKANELSEGGRHAKV